MTKCSFKFCKSVKPQHPKKDGMAYFRFPRHLIRREKWIEVVRRQRKEPSFEPNTGSLVCSKHFNKNDLYITDKGTFRLRDTAVPIIDPVNLNASTAEDKNKDDTNLLNEVISKPSTNEHIFEYSIKTSDGNESDDKKIKIDTSDSDIHFVDSDINKFSNDDNILPSTSYNSSDNDCEESAIMLIEVEESTDSEGDRSDEVSLEDRNEPDFIRTRDLDKFGEQVAAMLKRIPIKRALDLQPRIIKMITSAINENETIQIEDQLYGD